MTFCSKQRRAADDIARGIVDDDSCRIWKRARPGGGESDEVPKDLVPTCPFVEDPQAGEGISRDNIAGSLGGPPDRVVGGIVDDDSVTAVSKSTVSAGSSAYVVAQHSVPRRGQPNNQDPGGGIAGNDVAFFGPCPSDRVTGASSITIPHALLATAPIPDWLAPTKFPRTVFPVAPDPLM